MAKQSGGTPGRAVQAHQRRDARVRQVRKTGEVRRAISGGGVKKSGAGESFARAKPRQMRTTKQARAAGVASGDLDAARATLRPKVLVARARTVQTRQVAALKSRSLVRDIDAPELAKVARQRIAQGRQVKSEKLAARNRGASTK